MTVAFHPSSRWCTARDPWALLTVAAAACALIAFCAGPASAHTGLESSTPTDGANLKEGPRTIQLRFTENISPEFAQVTLILGEGQPQRLDTSVTGPQVVGMVPDDALSEDRTAWVVAYRVVSADGHPVSGTVEFTAGARNPSSPSSPAAPTRAPETEAPSGENPSPVADDADSEDTNGGSVWGLVGALVLLPALIVVLFVVTQRSDSEQRDQ